MAREVDMNFLVENWFWIVIALVFFWMHSKMHGGHGSRGSNRGHGSGMGSCMHHRGHDEHDSDQHDSVQREERSHAEH